MSHCKVLEQATGDVCIAIRDYSADQLHLGVLCKEDGEASVIHLSSHYSLRKSSNTDVYRYVDIQQFTEIDYLHMLTHILSIYELNCDEGIPYGPCGGGDISTSGEYVGEVGDGLTCSSFVLHMFTSQDYKFIDCSSWPSRDEDRDWQEEMIMDHNYKFGREESDVEHFKIQFEKLGALRFRPHEVAASVTFSEYQNDFTTVEPISLQIRDELVA
ncbi:hypothetical protein [Vibrio parahaemolyticus]|uniref:hypothetical protein n=1 Tax=Vibrio parahaemolyticus TaxID=670 RepID=UPI0023617070|nr:hypothetical protein [Vibrio parahaemolyticus]